MTVGKPVKIKVEYDDGSVRECEANDLSQEGKEALAKLGLFPLSIKDLNEGKKYVLVEWKNGWKEVFSVPPDVTEIRNYLVIRRAEEIGRLFLDKKEEYPELIEILRKPKDVERITLL